MYVLFPQKQNSGKSRFDYQTIILNYKLLKRAQKLQVALYIRIDK